MRGVMTISQHPVSDVRVYESNDQHLYRDVRERSCIG